MRDLATDRQLRIGDLARITGLSIKTLRYYERRGLLKPPPRTQGGYRLYGSEEVARLRFIQRAKLLGLKLEEIRELVELAARCNEGEIVPRLEEVLGVSWRRRSARWPNSRPSGRTYSTTASGPRTSKTVYPPTSTART
jgi:DNA-binding transcriptional MerR regulator